MPASTCRRALMTSTACSPRVIGALPEGPPKHFCKPTVTTSKPQSSVCSALPPMDAVASQYKITPASRHSAPISANGCNIVVDVSPCTIAKIFGWVSRMASAICWGSNTVPQGTSMVSTLAPQRLAISFSRYPKRPKIGTSTVSPGSTSDTIDASMAPLEVESTKNVH